MDDDRGTDLRDLLSPNLRRAGMRHLVVEDELLHRRQARASVLARPGRRDPATGGQRLDPAVRGRLEFGLAGVTVVAPGQRALAIRSIAIGEILGDEAADRIAERCLLLAIRPIHARNSQPAPGREAQQRHRRRRYHTRNTSAAARRASQLAGDRASDVRYSIVVTWLISGSPRRRRAKLSRKMSTTRSSLPPDTEELCGVISTSGMSHSGDSWGSGSSSKTSR